MNKMSDPASNEIGASSVQDSLKKSESDRLDNEPNSSEHNFGSNPLIDPQKQQQQKLQRQEQPNYNQNNPDFVNGDGNKRKLTLDRVVAMQSSELEVSPFSTPSSSRHSSLACSDDDWETIDESSDQESSLKDAYK